MGNGRSSNVWKSRNLELEDEREKDKLRSNKELSTNSNTKFDVNAFYQNQNLSADQLKACQLYIDPTPEPGSLHAISQNTNQELRKSASAGRQPNLSPTQQFMYDNIMSAMRPIGTVTTLTRYDHQGQIEHLLRHAGLNNPDVFSLSESQLKGLLVGAKYGEEKLLSTSYNDFKNASGGMNALTFKHRAIRFEYETSKNTQCMMPGNGAGGDLGEVVLRPSGGRQTMQITDVYIDKNVKVRKKGTASLSNSNQIVVKVKLS